MNHSASRRGQRAKPDNGSHVDIAQICERFDGRVVCVREARPGSYAARNAGLHVARGDVYAFTDADCIPTPDWLTTGLATFKESDTRILTAIVGRDYFPRPAEKRLPG